MRGHFEDLPLHQWLDMLFQPLVQPVESERMSLIRVHEELVSLLVVAVYGPAIHPQECVRRVEGGALVAVHKRIVHSKTFHERSSFLREVVVIAQLRSQESGLQRGLVPQSSWASEFLNGDFVYCQNFFDSRECVRQDLPSSSPRRRFLSRLA